MGELTFFLGLQAKQKEDGIFISQDKYVIEILKKFGFTDVKTASTPMETQKPLLKDEDGEEVDVHLYRSMIGSLMYLTSSRHDIMYAVCACARYQPENRLTNTMATHDLNGAHNPPCLAKPNLAKTKTNNKIEISKEMLIMLRDNPYNGAEANDAINHITRFLKIIDS
ncbi:hypothetical protein Tco_0240772 [Tanacetum coccineum]